MALAGSIEHRFKGTQLAGDRLPIIGKEQLAAFYGRVLILGFRFR